MSFLRLVLEQIQVTDLCADGTTILGNPGYISSPNYPSKYPDNTNNCNWMLIAPPGKTITLSFLAFQLETDSNCEFDYLAITMIIDDKEGNLTTLCGAALPNDTKSSGNGLYLQFYSDFNTNYIGFNISYEITGNNLKSYTSIAIAKQA